MNIKDAAYATVHDYKGGSEALAPRMGMSAAVLRNKVNPNNETHHLTLAEAVSAAAMAGDYRMLRAWAHQEGFLLIKAPNSKRAESDMSVLEQMVSFMVASGVYGQEIHEALADGRVTKDELRDVREAGTGVMTAVAEINQRLEGMAE